MLELGTFETRRMKIGAGAQERLQRIDSMNYVPIDSEQSDASLRRL